MTDSPSQARSAASLPPLHELSRQIRAGETTPEDIVERCLGRIQKREEDLHAWVYLAEAGARHRARALTEELKATGPRGPLHGIPFAVKDIFDTAGMPTEWGTAIHAGRTPDHDSALVAQLTEAGAIVLGKTVTTAFAYFDAGPTRNPHNLAHTPGGSSSGSAAAVADGMVPFAIGSQTMGSVLRPASFCGIAGFKPTFGRLALARVMPFAPSLDHAGFFTRTAVEMSFLWESLGNEVRPADDGARTLTVVRWPIGAPLEDEMADAFAALTDRLEGAGFTYSMWNGYLKEDSSRRVLDWLERNGIPWQPIHTSGHASAADLQRFAAALAPRALVPIHSFETGRFPEYFNNVVPREDGEWWEV